MIFAGNDSKLGFPATESSELLVAIGVFRHEILHRDRVHGGGSLLVQRIARRFLCLGLAYGANGNVDGHGDPEYKAGGYAEEVDTRALQNLVRGMISFGPS